MTLRLDIKAVGNTPEEEVKENLAASKSYRKATYKLLRYPPCIVAGGGPSTKAKLKELRKFTGDIFAINDTAGYLSDNGIPCTMFSIDGTRVPFHTGELVKGALFATRVSNIQYKQFKKKDIRTFAMMEDDPKNGVEGGATGVCRTPHLMIKMGYSKVYYYGIDGCFFNESHVGGTRSDARNNMIVIQSRGMNYLTNAAFMIQSQYMSELFRVYPKIYINKSGGLLAEMVKHPDEWGVVAVTKDIKEQHEKQGCMIWDHPYDFTENPIWMGKK